MGATAKSCLAAGGEVIGVIPDHLRFIEGEAMGLTALIRTETMHERKKVMFATADAFIVLPGGPGTLDETIETLTWRQLGLHMASQKFMAESFKGYYDVAPSPAEAIDAIRVALS